MNEKVYKNPFEDKLVEGHSELEMELLKLQQCNVDLGPIPKEMIH